MKKITLSLFLLFATTNLLAVCPYIDCTIAVTKEAGALESSIAEASGEITASLLLLEFELKREKNLSLENLKKLDEYSLVLKQKALLLAEVNFYMEQYYKILRAKN